MAGSINKVILVGNLGRDPEVRRLNSGDPVVNLNVATSESWRDKETGERKERTNWHRIVIFNEHICRLAEQYLKKGAKVYVEGQLETREWEKDGVKHYTTEVVLRQFRGDLQMMGGSEGRPAQDPDSYGTVRTREDFGSGDTGNSYADQKGRGAYTGVSQFKDELDDEIPFEMPWQ